MNLLKETQDLCRLYGIKPSRSKGQNFLIEEKVYDEMVGYAELKSDDVVLEVGPGLGFLTMKLAARVKRVIAVELDSGLAEALEARLMAAGIKNVEVVQEDILRIKNYELKIKNEDSKSPPSLRLRRTSKIQNLDPGIRRDDLREKSWGDKKSLPLGKGEDRRGSDPSYKVVANLPYNITSIFLRKFLEMEVKPTSLTLMLQQEVAERICAEAGRMNLLALSVQYYAQPRILQVVGRKNFWPMPEVDSAIIQLTVNSNQLSVNSKQGEIPNSNDSSFAKATADTQWPNKIPNSKFQMPNKFQIPNSKQQINEKFPPHRRVANEATKLKIQNLDPDFRRDDKTKGIEHEDDKLFFRLAKIGFSAKRKMLKNNLAAGLKIGADQAEKIIVDCGFNAKCRPQDLSLEDYQKLFAALGQIVV